MKHPFFQQIRFLGVYFAVWVLVLLIHTTILYLLNGWSLFTSLTDSFVSNFLFSLMGLSLWYTVLYNDIERQSYVAILVNHLSILAVAMIFWVSTSTFFLRLALSHDLVFMEALDRSIPYRVLSGVFYYVTLSMIYYLIIYSNNLRRRSLQESYLKEKIKEAELQTLKAQINPHFLFNGLNSISSLTLSNPDKAHEMIIKLSGFLRYSLAHDPKQLIPLNKELENMAAYVAVEKVRFGDKLVFTQDIQTECGEQKVPFLILQPLIENAIKHGVYESLTPVNVSVSCKKLRGNKLEIKIGNDFDAGAVQRKGTGTGLKNIKERLRIIYQMDELMTFQKRDNYFEVTLIIPCSPAKP